MASAILADEPATTPLEVDEKEQAHLVGCA
jgi:hypothetical protein